MEKPQLNKSCVGYTKMKERPGESYWQQLQSSQMAAGVSQEALERQSDELSAMYNNMLSYSKKARAIPRTLL